jgi:branched-chain amino acid transport system permease protein
MMRQANRPGGLATAAMLGVILLGLCLAASSAAPAFQRIVTEALIKLVVVVGMFTFIGNSGVLSFGHVSFMAIGGYISAILTIPAGKKQVLLDLPGWLESLQLPGALSMPVAAVCTALIGLAVGFPLMRLRGIALPMATFALLAITHVVASNWREVTGGRQALVGLPRFTDLWIAGAIAVLVLFVAALYQTSRRGTLLRCSREDEVAAAASGIDVARERLIAFVLSAFLVALGGVLFAHFLGTMTANTFYLDLTFVTLAMLVVGGMRSLTGACLGVAVVSVVAELFRTIERGVELGGMHFGAPPGLQEIALALILVAILIFRPDGIAGDRELTWPPSRSILDRMRTVARSGGGKGRPEY